MWRKPTNERKKMKIMRMALRNITFVQNRNIGIVRGYRENEKTHFWDEKWGLRKAKSGNGIMKKSVF